MTDMTRPTRPDLSCDDVRELAASFVLGALDADEADAVRAHLASCADPHAEMAELGSVLLGPRRERAGGRAAGGAEGPDPGGRGRGSRDARGRAAAAARADRAAPRRSCRRPRRAPRRPRSRRADRAPAAGRQPPGHRGLDDADRGRAGDRVARRLGPAAPEPARRARRATSRASRRCSTWPASRAR